MDQPDPWLSWLLASAAVVLVGIAKSGFGGGVGIVAVPLFVMAFNDSTRAIGALLPLLIAADILSVWHHWGKWDKPNLKSLSIGTAVGIVAGTLILAWLIRDGQAGTDQAEGPLKLIIGIICIGYVLLDRLKARFVQQWHIPQNYLTGTIAGGAVGITTTLAHAAGPIAAIYLLGQGLAKNKFIGTAVIYFFTINVVKLIPYSMLGLIQTELIWTGLWLIPGIPVGTWLGARLNHIMSEGIFRGIILFIVFLTGVQFTIGLNPMQWFG